MPNPDGSLNWNDPGFVSTLQQYQNLGGDMNRAAEFLYAGAGANDPTQTNGTIKDRIRNMEAPETEWQRNQNMLRDQGFASGFLNSSGYNPGGANSYLISNSVGLNSGNPTGKYWNAATKTWGTQSPYAARNTPETRLPTNGGAPPGTTPPPATNAPPTGGNVQNNAETLQSNSINLNKNRAGYFKRSNVGGYSNGAQYYQSASLPSAGGSTPGSGYGGLGYSSARGNPWSSGNWNKAIWS